MHRVFWSCNGRDCYSERNCPFDGWSGPELQKPFETKEQTKKNAEPIHFVDRVRKIGGFYEQLLTVD